jgi:hypothetical protein
LRERAVRLREKEVSGFDQSTPTKLNHKQTRPFNNQKHNSNITITQSEQPQHRSKPITTQLWCRGGRSEATARGAAKPTMGGDKPHQRNPRLREKKKKKKEKRKIGEDDAHDLLLGEERDPPGGLVADHVMDELPPYSPASSSPSATNTWRTGACVSSSSPPPKPEIQPPRSTRLCFKAERARPPDPSCLP